MLGLSNSGEYSEDFGRVQILSYVSAAVNDFIIAVAMLRHFVKVRRKGIAENSGKILVRLAILTISTNTFTTGVTLASMISYITESGGGGWFRDSLYASRLNVHVCTQTRF